MSLVDRGAPCSSLKQPRLGLLCTRPTPSPATCLGCNLPEQEQEHFGTSRPPRPVPGSSVSGIFAKYLTTLGCAKYLFPIVDLAKTVKYNYGREDREYHYRQVPLRKTKFHYC